MVRAVYLPVPYALNEVINTTEVAAFGSLYSN